MIKFAIQAWEQYRVLGEKKKRPSEKREPHVGERIGKKLSRSDHPENECERKAGPNLYVKLLKGESFFDFRCERR